MRTNWRRMARSSGSQRPRCEGWGAVACLPLMLSGRLTKGKEEG